MSLETVIAENTAALKELIAAISKGTPIAASTVAQVAQQTTAENPQADAKKPGAEAKATAATASSPSGAAQKTTAQQASAPVANAGEPKELSYDDIKAPFLQLIKDKGRDAAANLLKPFGAAKLPDVKPEDFAAVLDAINVAQGEEALA